MQKKIMFACVVIMLVALISIGVSACSDNSSSQHYPKKVLLCDEKEIFTWEGRHYWIEFDQERSLYKMRHKYETEGTYVTKPGEICKTVLSSSIVQ